MVGTSWMRSQRSSQEYPFSDISGDFDESAPVRARARKLKRNFFKGTSKAVSPDFDFERSESMESHMVSRFAVRLGIHVLLLRFRMSRM